MIDEAVTLARIETKLDALREDVEQLAARGRISRDERALLADLLPAAAVIVNDAVFACVDLYDVPTLRGLLNGYSPSALSWLLGRAARSRIAGYRVERVGTDRGGALWRLEREVAARTVR